MKNKKISQWRQQGLYWSSCLTVKNSSFASVAQEFFIYVHFGGVLVLSTTQNDLFCSCVDVDKFFFLSPNCWDRFDSRIVRTYSASKMTWNNQEVISEKQSWIFRWCPLSQLSPCLAPYWIWLLIKKCIEVRSALAPQLFPQEIIVSHLHRGFFFPFNQ